MSDPTDSVSDDELREIIAGCHGVTRGPWAAGSNGYNSGVYVMAVSFKEEVCEVFDDSETAVMPQAENAAHIARLDPATVFSIASELLALRTAKQPYTRPAFPYENRTPAETDVHLTPTAEKGK